jgi:hypothetical protein
MEVDGWEPGLGSVRVVCKDTVIGIGSWELPINILHV